MVVRALRYGGGGRPEVEYWCEHTRGRDRSLLLAEDGLALTSYGREDRDDQRD